MNFHMAIESSPMYISLDDFTNKLPVAWPALKRAEQIVSRPSCLSTIHSKRIEQKSTYLTVLDSLE